MRIEIKNLRALVINSALGATFIAVAFGCGGAYQSNRDVSDLLGSKGGGAEQPPLSDEPAPEVIAGRRTASVLNYETVLESMVAQTGQMPSTNTFNRFQNRLGMLSETGAVTTVNSSTLQAIAGTASDICADLTATEFNAATPPANVRFFTSLTNRAGTASSQFTTEATSDVVRRMARSFWQRNETAEELALITTGIQEAITAQTNMTARNMGLYICTAMLSTVSAIEL